MVTRVPDLTLRSRYDGKRMSFEEYMALPEEKPYLEYAHGRVVQKMSPRIPHSWTVTTIMLRLSSHLGPHGGALLPECRVLFQTERGTEAKLPDLAWWAPGRPLWGDRETGLPPTLAIEIRSPDETMESQREKCRFYRRYGVDACWLIDPGQRVEERFEGAADAERVRAGGTLTAVVLPGFELPLADLFASLDN